LSATWLVVGDLATSLIGPSATGAGLSACGAGSLVAREPASLPPAPSLPASLLTSPTTSRAGLADPPITLSAKPPFGDCFLPFGLGLFAGEE
jgi:hypothetical protein